MVMVVVLGRRQGEEEGRSGEVGDRPHRQRRRCHHVLRKRSISTPRTPLHVRTPQVQLGSVLLLDVPKISFKND